MGRFPNNKRFAFTVFDDTDYSTVENVEPVYRLLAELGIRTTKSVWPLACVPGPRIDGSTLQDVNYRDFVRWLQREGFEIGLHNVRNHDATREVVEQGFEDFSALLRQEPRTHCNHTTNRENLYWGSDRIATIPIRFGYNVATRFARRKYFEGHVENSPYFWGDLCKKRLTYVRNFVFDEINLDRVNPSMPYHDHAKPFVNLWFSSSEGSTVTSFCDMLSEANQDQLEAEGGVCIMYTHFASGFYTQSTLHPRFEQLMRRLATMNGWFVPVATLLDHLKTNRAELTISSKELAHMERRWFFSKLRKGTT